MWTVAIWFFLFMFAINGMLLYVDSALPAYSLVSPIDNSTITPATQPNVTGVLNNSTGATATNSTDTGDSIGIWDTVSYAWNQTIFVVNLLTGGFIWQALDVFGLPAEVYVVIQGSMGFFLIITVLHFWRGIL